MIRKQVYLEPRQDRILKQLARESERSEAEIIREAIELLAERGGRPSDSLSQILAFVDDLIAQGAIPGGRAWRREDLYDD